MHTTNYFNTLIEVADDCPVIHSEVPPLRGAKRSVANLQYEILSSNRYVYTSDDILFTVFAIRNEISGADRSEARRQFFSKGQPCFRASPLPKRYGYGIHFNEEGKAALYGVNTAEYDALRNNPEIRKVKAMRTKRT